jgi:hypothetical protein
MLLIIEIHSFPLTSLQFLKAILSIPKVICIISLLLKGQLVLAATVLPNVI